MGKSTCHECAGEVFGGLSIAPGASDSQALLQALNQGDVLRVFNCLRGPWAAVYWHASTRKLWFGRDLLGRRSLLVHYPISSQDCFCLVSSAATPAGYSAAAGVASAAALPDSASCSAAEASQPAEKTSFQEVQPGLYSVHLPTSPEPAPMSMQVQHDDWQDPLLCCIRDFLRPERCITPPQPPSASPVPVREAPSTAGTAVASFADSTPDSKVTAAAEVAALPAPPVAYACQKTATDTQDMHSLHAPSQLSFDGAVDLMLTALARSVAVRCQCIDQHFPHKQPVSQSADVTSQASVLPSQAGTGKAGEAATCTDSGTVKTNHDLDTSLHQAQTNSNCRQMDASCRQHGNQDIALLRQPGLATASVQQSLTAQTEGNHLPQDLGTPAMAASDPTPVLQPHAQRPTPSAVNQNQPSQTTVESPNQHQAAALEPAPVLILFSGGVDSTLIAALAHQALPPGVPIDLASVCFTGGESGDRQAALDALQELADFAPAREWRLIRVNSSLEEVDAHKDWLLGLLYPSATVMDLNIGAALWMAAKAEGQVTVVAATTASKQAPNKHEAATVLPEATQAAGAEAATALPEATQTSGAERAFPEATQTSGPEAATALPGAADPAGDTSHSSTPLHRSVQAQTPSQQAAQVARTQGDLGNPSALVHEAYTSQEGQDQAACTPSASSAMLHAATPCSQAASSNMVEPCKNGRLMEQVGSQQDYPRGYGYGWYKSAARVVLLGHGADEQHAGYGRHRTSFRKQAWSGLQEELAVDMQRLWQRNLGRDDRLVADTSREARHPFLDEEYIQAVLNIPLWLIANLADAPGQGDKRLLRAALQRLGLTRAAVRVKRAMQFGTGISKLSNVRSFGSNRAANGKNAGSLHLESVTNM